MEVAVNKQNKNQLLWEMNFMWSFLASWTQKREPVRGLNVLALNLVSVGKNDCLPHHMVLAQCYTLLGKTVVLWSWDVVVWFVTPCSQLLCSQSVWERLQSWSGSWIFGDRLHPVASFKEIVFTLAWLRHNSIIQTLIITNRTQMLYI